MQRHARCLIAWAAAGLVFGSAGASATRAGAPDPDDPNDLKAILAAFGGDDLQAFEDIVVDGLDDGTYQASIVLGGPDIQLPIATAELTGDFDPFLQSELTVTNPLDDAPVQVSWQAVIDTISIPGPPWTADTFLSIELVDNNSDGVSADVLPNPGSPPYLGAAVATASPATPVGLPDDLTDLPALGVPATLLTGPGPHVFDPNPVVMPEPPQGESWRALLLGGAFLLSPGDSASVVSRVDQMPEPGAGVLLGLSCCVLFRRRRGSVASGGR
jgi:hypothetical protein